MLNLTSLKGIKLLSKEQNWKGEVLIGRGSEGDHPQNDRRREKTCQNRANDQRSLTDPPLPLVGDESKL